MPKPLSVRFHRLAWDQPGRPSNHSPCDSGLVNAVEDQRTGSSKVASHARFRRIAADGQFLDFLLFLSSGFLLSLFVLCFLPLVFFSWLSCGRARVHRGNLLSHIPPVAVEQLPFFGAVRVATHRLGRAGAPRGHPPKAGLADHAECLETAAGRPIPASTMSSDRARTATAVSMICRRLGSARLGCFQHGEIEIPKT